jgi:oligoendopeptidase F
MKNKFRLILTVTLMVVALNSVFAQTRERSSVEAKYTWKLEDIYASDNDWRIAKEKLMSEIPVLESYKGKLTSSSPILVEFLNKYYDFVKTYTRIYSYASMKSDQDLG